MQRIELFNFHEEGKKITDDLKDGREEHRKNKKDNQNKMIEQNQQKL